MKTIIVYDRDGNKSQCIYQNDKGIYLAMTWSQSREFKTLKGAERWIAKFL